MRVIFGNYFYQWLLQFAPGQSEAGLAAILDVYELDNVSPWDCDPNDVYICWRPAPVEARRGSQEVFMELARSEEAKETEQAASPRLARKE
jgi:hypothetical protein